MLRLEGAVAARGSFSAFRRSLEAHLDAEDAWVVPPFGRECPDAAERIRADHAELRARALALAVCFDAGAVEPHLLAELLEILDRHARFEESDFYRWADVAIDEASSRAVLREIEAAELGER
jgi:hypothetical protein